MRPVKGSIVAFCFRDPAASEFAERVIAGVVESWRGDWDAPVNIVTETGEYAHADALSVYGPGESHPRAGVLLTEDEGERLRFVTALLLADPDFVAQVAAQKTARLVGWHDSTGQHTVSVYPEPFTTRTGAPLASDEPMALHLRDRWTACGPEMTPRMDAYLSQDRGRHLRLKRVVAELRRRAPRQAAIWEAVHLDGMTVAQYCKRHAVDDGNASRQLAAAREFVTRYLGEHVAGVTP